jgi:hypothetical protein
MSAFRKYLAISPTWYFNVLESFDEYFNPIENEFIMNYHKYLMFKKSFINTSIITFCGNPGLRIDRVIQCEVLKKPVGQTLKFGYLYKYANENDYYRSEYKFDAVK